jgi:hypothetical protein
MKENQREFSRQPTKPPKMPMTDGFVKTWPRTLLRLEGLCIFSGAIWAFHKYSNQPWWVFVGGLLVPDLAMAGYLSNTTLGAAVYNSAHTETPPLVLLAAGVALEKPVVLGVALIWLAHIGMDRMFGFGLKYGTGFAHTHLGDFAKGDGKAGKS